MAAKQTLVLIGAGPKSIAICAKAAVLARLGYSIPDIIVLEQYCIAAHWYGQHGYTDGTPRLGTPPEKDIGFPYASSCWGGLSGRVNELMASFSWSTYKIEKGLYSDWVDRGRCHPPHKEFAQYLEWCAAKSINWQSAKKTGRPADGSIVFYQETSLNSVDVVESEKKWNISWRNSKGNLIEKKVDAIMFSGPGSPILLPGQPLDQHERVLDGADFWTRRSTICNWNKNKQSTRNVAIVGAGETAAAIAVSLVAPDSPVGTLRIINPYGVLFSRGESFTENQMFTKPDYWSQLSSNDREQVVRRGDRGVFSVQAQDILNNAERVSVRAGRVSLVEAGELQVQLHIEYDHCLERLPCDYLVSAVGFFPLSFLSIFERKAKSKLLDLFGKKWKVVETDRTNREGQQELVKEFEQKLVNQDLGMKDFGPTLHLPMLACHTQGPGFANLSCLGLLSDRVLLPYTSRKEKCRRSPVVAGRGRGVTRRKSPSVKVGKAK